MGSAFRFQNFQNDEELFNFVSADVVFGFSELYQILKKNSGINSVLEIGSGSGILLNELKTFFPNINFKGVDPNEGGFHQYKEIYESLNKREFEIENIQIEKFSAKENFDLIFSINVLEHVIDWKKYIYQTSNLLNDNGLNIIFVPNYDFPYEPHFVIPIVIPFCRLQRVMKGFEWLTIVDSSMTSWETPRFNISSPSVFLVVL